jgi:hypothetical protein
MKFCPVVPEICRGQVHGARKERRIRIRIIIIRNGAKTISLPNRKNDHKCAHGNIFEDNAGKKAWDYYIDQRTLSRTIHVTSGNILFVFRTVRNEGGGGYGV